MELLTLFKACKIILAPSLMAGIVTVESGEYPYWININSADIEQKKHRFLNATAAVEASKRLINGGYSIDMGLAQINSNNLESLGIEVGQIFDPCTNLLAAQTIFLDGYDRESDKGMTAHEKEIAALSRYNTGDKEKGVENGYVRKVLSAINQEVESKEVETKIKKPTAIGDDGFTSIPDGYSKR